MVNKDSNIHSSVKTGNSNIDTSEKTGNSNIHSSEKTGNSKSVIKLEDVNHAESMDADLRNISESLKIKTLNPEFPGNQKYPGKNTRNSDGLGKAPESTV